MPRNLTHSGNIFFNNQTIPTYNSPDQKQQMDKMNMLNNPSTVNAYQQYPIQSQNGAFTEGTNNQIRPTDSYGGADTSGGMGGGFGSSRDSDIPMGTIKDGKKWNGKEWEAIGYESTGDDTGGGTGTGGGYNDHIPIGTMKDGLTWNGKAWVNVNTGTDTDVVIESDTTGDDTGGGNDTNGDDTGGDDTNGDDTGGYDIAPTGGTGTDTGFTSWTGQQGSTGNWMNVFQQNAQADQPWQDYSQGAGTSSFQNPFTNITGDMQSGIDYFRDQGIGVGSRYGRYFQDYDPAREEAAGQQFGFGQKEAMTGSRTGLMGLTQQQGIGGFQKGPDVGGTAAARGIRGQFGTQQEQAALGLRGDIYGMRREQEDDWWTTLSRIEQARGAPFGAYTGSDYIDPITIPTEAEGDNTWSPPNDPIQGQPSGTYEWDNVIYLWDDDTGWVRQE